MLGRLRACTARRSTCGKTARWRRSRETLSSAAASDDSLDFDDPEDSLQGTEVGRIACVKRQFIRRSRGSDKQVRQADAARLSGSPRGREHASVHARGFRVKRQRIPRGRCPLQSILAPSALVLVLGCMWTRSKLGKRHRRNCGFIRKLLGINQVVIDYDGSVQNAASRISRWHADRLRYRDLRGIERHRCARLFLRRRR